MGDRFRDFDAEADARRLDPISFRMFGKEWVVPGEPPAALVLRTARFVAELRAEHGDDVDLARLEGDLPAEQLVLLATDAISAPVLRRLQDEGLTTSQLGDLIGWLLSEWKVFEQGGGVDRPGEAPAPPGADSTTPSSRSGVSSIGGATSKRTSPASTPSPSPTPAASTSTPLGPSPAPRPWAV